ncbi:hypothetical protein BUY49_10300 [Staphylococcus devriesei]|nr:hypothetical protein [Staphylococcus devriesei]RIL70462.1 hypothetical protein BUY49_10300 [Staphylococcus devriesei]
MKTEKSAKELPETGDSTSNQNGALFAGLGALLLDKRRKKHNNK